MQEPSLLVRFEDRASRLADEVREEGGIRVLKQLAGSFLWGEDKRKIGTELSLVSKDTGGPLKKRGLSH